MTVEVHAEWFLDELRKLGDPKLDESTWPDSALPLHGAADGDFTAIAELTTIRLDRGAHGMWDGHGEVDIVARLDDVETARRLFGRFGTEITAALLLAALPQAYACAWGARVLLATGRLSGRQTLDRRVRGTASFLLHVLSADPIEWTDPRSPVRLQCARLRAFHEQQRRTLRSADADTKALLGVENEMPLNQEDLLGMLLSFGITTFEALEEFGIAWTADEQEAYLHLWDLVGACLGIGYLRMPPDHVDGAPEQPSTSRQQSKHRPEGPPSPDPRVIESLQSAGLIGLRPADRATTRRLLRQLQLRQWLPTEFRRSQLGKITEEPWPPKNPGRSIDRAGRLLIRPLLIDLAKAMPAPLRTMPLSVMRQLNPPIVRQRLNLGGDGLVLGLLDQLPRRRHMVDRFTAIRTPSRLSAKVLRAMANEVARRYGLMQLREGVVLPGLDLASFEAYD